MDSTAPRVAIYVRISRDRVGAGIGVERQEADCRDLASQFNPQTITVYSDNDLSAYSGKPRPAYLRLLRDIETGHVDVVMAWHLDRLHRSPIELEQWITTCEPRAVSVHTVKAGPIDLATPSGRMVARQLGTVARYESEHRSERVVAAMRDLAARGQFRGGRRPFGFEIDGVTVKEDEAELIRSGVRSLLAGNSLRSVVVQWNAAGATTTGTGREWDLTAARAVLTRARNAGLIERHGTVIGPATWPAIVGESQWRGLCAILGDPARRTNMGRTSTRWLGSGLYRCGMCGGTLRVGTSGAGQRAAYRCSRATNRGGPVHVSRAAEHLDEYISTIIVRRLSMDDARDLLVPTRPDLDTDQVREDIASIEAQRVELAARQGRAEISLAQFDAANAGMVDRQRSLERQLSEHMIENPVAELIEVGDVAARWDEIDLSARRAVLAHLMTVTVLKAGRGRHAGGSYFDPDSVRIDWN